jgi:hypothetical protein
MVLEQGDHRAIECLFYRSDKQENSYETPLWTQFKQQIINHAIAKSTIVSYLAVAENEITRVKKQKEKYKSLYLYNQLFIDYIPDITELGCYWRQKIWF